MLTCIFLLNKGRSFKITGSTVNLFDVRVWDETIDLSFVKTNRVSLSGPKLPLSSSLVSCFFCFLFLNLASREERNTCMQQQHSLNPLAVNNLYSSLQANHTLC